MNRVCKPNSVIRQGRTAVIYLDPVLLPGSSGLPEGTKGEQPLSRQNGKTFCLTLLQVGFTLSCQWQDPVTGPSTLLPKRWALTSPFHPYPN